MTETGSHARYARLNDDGTWEAIEDHVYGRRRSYEILAAWVVPIIVFLAIPTAAAFYVQDRNAKDLLYKNQLSACYRGNDLRSALRANEKGLEQFVTDARNIRQAQADEYRAQGDVEQAALNQAAADAYATTLKSLETIELIDCKTTIKHS